MKCEYCSADVAEEMVFCLNCGTKIRPAAPHPAPVPVPEESPAVKKETPVIPKLSEFPEIRFSWELGENAQPVVRLEPVRQEREEETAPEEAETVPAREEMEREVLRSIPNLWLPTGRSWVKMLLLGIVTLGIYPAVVWSRMATELNIAASRHDGKRTMPWFAMAALSVVTLSVFSFVWNHRFCRRVGAELERRHLDARLSPRDFWLWNVLGSLILVGPVIYVHRVTNAMNLINADFNSCG